MACRPKVQARVPPVPEGSQRAVRKVDAAQNACERNRTNGNRVRPFVRHGQHGVARLAEHFLRNRTQHQVLETRSSVRPHHDQIGLDLVGDLQDLHIDVGAFTQFDGDAPRLGSFGRRERRELPQDVCAMAIGQRERLEFRQSREGIRWNRYRKDMQCGDTAVVEMSDRDRLVQRMTREIGEIDRAENPF